MADAQDAHDTETTVWGELEGRTITFPMAVPEVHIATALFAVPADGAARLLPGDAFEVAEATPGEAHLVIAACDYVDNPWGDYDEVNLGLMARPRGADPGTIGTFVWRMPVNQAFTCTAGNLVMGFPKTVEQIDVTTDEVEVTFRLSCAGVHALTLAVPRVPTPDEPPARLAAESYSYLDGVPHTTTLEMDLGAAVDPGAVRLELGDGPIADELRSLGLPSTPLLATWGASLGAVFHPAVPLDHAHRTAPTS